MISIDTVYQKVLTLANKEQRGYITPIEFNLLANQAQLEIFEQYFYDLNQFKRTPVQEDTQSDIVNLLEDKISLFESTFAQETAVDNSGLDLSVDIVDLYRIDSIYWTDSNDKIISARKVSRKDALLMNDSLLLKPSETNPTYTLDNPGTNLILKIQGANPTNLTIEYIKTPTPPSWGYVVVDKTPIYNATISRDFGLHPSEEPSLVNKILELSGIVINKPGLSQLATQSEQIKNNQEKQ